MNDIEAAALAKAHAVLAKGNRLQELVAMLLAATDTHDCPPDQHVRLQAAADQLSAALRELRAQTGRSPSTSGAPHGRAAGSA